MSIFSPMVRSLKEIKGEKLTLKEKICGWWYDLWRYTPFFSRIRDFKYILKHLLWDRYDLIRTKLPKHKYYDTPMLMLHGNMEMLVDFVENENCYDKIDFDSDEFWRNIGSEIKEIYLWWKDYKNREKEIDIALNNWHDTKFTDKNEDILTTLNKPDSIEVKRYSEIHEQLEKKLAEEEEAMLIKLMKIRPSLWT